MLPPLCHRIWDRAAGAPWGCYCPAQAGKTPLRLVWNTLNPNNIHNE